MTIPNKPAELMSQTCLDRINMLASLNSAKACFSKPDWSLFSSYWKFKSLDEVFNLAQSDDIHDSLAEVIGARKTKLQLTPGE